MLENLKEQAPDKIIELIGLYAADTRANKLDLGVGVYKDAKGNTPVMRAVKAAEAQLLAEQDTKKYVGLLGDLSYVDAIRDLILGDSVAAGRVCGAQEPGGTGAIRQLFELIKAADAGATVWISNPSWPNHEAILKYLGMNIGKYRYFDEASCGVDFAGMKADLEGAAEGDVLLLHGCCHNPTGANITSAEWAEVAEIALAQKLMPMIDIAYQGFGDGLEDDTAGVRIMAAKVPEMLVAASCSKNFGLYRDRVGAALIISKDEAATALSKANIAGLNRVNFSFPPDHGAKVVSIIMNDDALRADWASELEDMRLSMLDLRQGLADALRRETNSDRFDFIAEHRGMFSRLGLSPEQVMQLRSDHAIYMVGDSRVNIAGLPKAGLDSLAKAIASVI
ncbi:MAG: aminotransferase class I/II-fold pyridoxal phosphate-dependent enzyme [Rhodobacteraceae bacterium]|nr:aminotransferase class I/II-fold pyridoxal phosphate-dependent enzyme [Paracoccaceae bacterium]